MIRHDGTSLACGDRVGQRESTVVGGGVPVAGSAHEPMRIERRFKGQRASDVEPFMRLHIAK